jgi:hypothetical protein
MDFKPNIYPIMYWALAFGVVAGLLLFLINLLSQYITIVWFPVFLAGLIWGGYRNYQIQKKNWQSSSGQPATPQSPMNEFKQAVADITEASKEVFNQSAQATQLPPQENAAPDEPETEAPQEEQVPPTQPTPPQL